MLYFNPDLKVWANDIKGLSLICWGGAPRNTSCTEELIRDLIMMNLVYGIIQNSINIVLADHRIDLSVGSTSMLSGYVLSVLKPE